MKGFDPFNVEPLRLFESISGMSKRLVQAARYRLNNCSPEYKDDFEEIENRFIAIPQLRHPAQEIEHAFPNMEKMIMQGYRPTIGDLVPTKDECVHNHYGNNPTKFIEFLLRHLTDPSTRMSFPYWQKYFACLFQSTDQQLFQQSDRNRNYGSHANIDNNVEIGCHTLFICNDCSFEILIGTKNFELLKTVFDRIGYESTLFCQTDKKYTHTCQMHLLVWMLDAAVNNIQIAKIFTRSPTPIVKYKNGHSYNRSVNFIIKIWRHQIKSIASTPKEHNFYNIKDMKRLGYNTIDEMPYFYVYGRLCRLISSVYYCFTIRDWKILIKSNLIVDMFDIIATNHMYDDMNKDQMYHSSPSYGDFILGCARDGLLSIFLEMMLMLKLFKKGKSANRITLQKHWKFILGKISKKIQFCDQFNNNHYTFNCGNGKSYKICKAFFENMTDFIHQTVESDTDNEMDHDQHLFNILTEKNMRNHRRVFAIREQLWCANTQCNKTSNALSRERNIGDYRIILKLCKGCRVAKYCSKTCQKVHWKASHRLQCKKIQQLWYDCVN